MHIPTTTILLSGLLATVSSRPSSGRRGRSRYNATAPSSLVFETSEQTWFENIVTTRNNTLLVARSGVPELRIVDPYACSNSSNASLSSVIYTFPEGNALGGITELDTDVFAVVINQQLEDGGYAQNSSSVWTVDLRATGSSRTGEGAVVEKVTDVPNSWLLNGAAALNERSLLITDSFNGNVVRVDVDSGDTELVMDDRLLAGNVTDQIPFGANGIKIVGGNAYIINTREQTLLRVPANSTTGRPTGEFTVVTDQLGGPDDLAVAEDGTAFVADLFVSSIKRVTTDGEVTTITGEPDALVVEPTSVSLGRGYRSRSTIYVATTGGQAFPGSVQSGARVVAVSIN
jgi:hypothetical protein